MLREVSWVEYGVVVGITTAIYWLVIGWWYYRNDIRNWLRSFRLAPIHSPFSAPVVAAYQELKRPEVSGFGKAAPLSDLYEVMEDLKQLFRSLPPTVSKADLIIRLQHTLQQHAWLSSSGFQDSVLQHIQQECNTHCQITLEAADLKRIVEGND